MSVRAAWILMWESTSPFFVILKEATYNHSPEIHTKFHFFISRPSLFWLLRFFQMLTFIEKKKKRYVDLINW